MFVFRCDVDSGRNHFFAAHAAAVVWIDGGGVVLVSFAFLIHFYSVASEKWIAFRVCLNWPKQHNYRKLELVALAVDVCWQSRSMCKPR